MRLALACAALTMAAQAQDWQRLDYYPGYSWSPAAAGTFTFPDAAVHSHYPAFLVVTQVQAMDLSNAVIRCRFTVEGAATFRYGGEGSWNLGPRPASVRLFFSSDIGYDNNTPAPTNYWFNTPWSAVTNQGIVTLEARLDHAGEWTDAMGGNDVAAFWTCARHVQQVGVAFGGGNFYDVGVAVVTGSATFRLLEFTVTPRFSMTSDLRIIGGFSQATYRVYRSDDLEHWSCWTNGISPGFYRAKVGE